METSENAVRVLHANLNKNASDIEAAGDPLLKALVKIARIYSCEQFYFFLAGELDLPEQVRLDSIEMMALNEGFPYRNLLFRIGDAA